MALSDDQRAMLRLLAQREQGYEDMAALMGVSVEELRSRVKDALAQLQSEGETAPQLPEPPKAEPSKAEEPEAAPAKAAEPEPKPKEPTAAPQPPVESEPPELSATPPAGAVPPSLPPKDGKSGGKGFSLSSNGTRVALGAIAGAVAIVVILLIALGGGGGSDSSSTTVSETGGTTTTAEGETELSANPVPAAEKAAEATQGGREATKAVLSGSGEARGIAIFGRIKNKLALQIVAEGLEPLKEGDAYAIWIAASPQKMLPLAASEVSEKGTIVSQFEVPTELVSYLANETFKEIAITEASETKLNTSVKKATSEKTTPSYYGTDVLRGTITGPIVGAAQRLKEKEAEGKEGE